MISILAILETKMSLFSRATGASIIGAVTNTQKIEVKKVL